MKLSKADQKSLSELTAELTAKAEKLRAGKDAEDKQSKDLLKVLPVFLIRPIVALTGWLASSLNLDIPALGVRACPAGTCMITSVGSMGVSQGFAPLTPFVRVPIILTVGGIEKKPTVVSEGGEDKIVIQHQLIITVRTINFPIAVSRFFSDASRLWCVFRLRSTTATPMALRSLVWEITCVVYWRIHQSLIHRMRHRIYRHQKAPNRSLQLQLQKRLRQRKNKRYYFCSLFLSRCGWR